jgi:hypothetical protein
MFTEPLPSNDIYINANCIDIILTQFHMLKWSYVNHVKQGYFV